MEMNQQKGQTMRDYGSTCETCGEPSWGAPRCLGCKTPADKAKMAEATRSTLSKVRRLVAKAHGVDISDVRQMADGSCYVG